MPAGTTRLLTLTLLVGATSIVAARSPTIQTEAMATAQPAARLPLRLGQWAGTEIPVPADVQRALPSAQILSRQYRGPLGAADLTVVSGSDATALHDPHDCLAGSGWHFLKDRPRWVDTGTRAGRIQVRDVLMVNGAMRARMWYWYAIGSQIYNRTLSARLGLFRVRLTQGRGPRAEFVRLIVDADSDSAPTTAMLTDLVRQVESSS